MHFPIVGDFSGASGVNSQLTRLEQPRMQACGEGQWGCYSFRQATWVWGICPPASPLLQTKGILSLRRKLYTSHFTFPFSYPETSPLNSSSLSLLLSQVEKGSANHSCGIGLHFASGLRPWWAAVCRFEAYKGLGGREWNQQGALRDRLCALLERKAHVRMTGRWALERIKRSPGTRM